MLVNYVVFTIDAIECDSFVDKVKTNHPTFPLPHFTSSSAPSPNECFDDDDYRDAVYDDETNAGIERVKETEGWGREMKRIGKTMIA